MHDAISTSTRRPGKRLLALAALLAVLVGAPRPTHPGLAPTPLPRSVASNHDDLQTLVASLDLEEAKDILPGPDNHVVRLAVSPHMVRLAVDPRAVHPLSGPVAVRQNEHLGSPGRPLRLVSLAPAAPASPEPQPAAAPANTPAPVATPQVAVKNTSPPLVRPAPPVPGSIVAKLAAAPAPLTVAAKSVAAPGRSILVAGDSLSIDLAEALRPLLSGRPGAAFTARGKVSSGLARPDFFNWEREMTALAATSRPDTVLVMIATNDNQTLSRPDGKKVAFGRPGWDEEYARRVRRLVELARQGNPGARVYWIGAPVMADAKLNADVAAINAVIARQIAALPGCRFIDVSRTLADAAGRYVPALPAPGGPRAARTKDGVHLTPFGAKLLAHATLASMSPAVAELERP